MNTLHIHPKLIGATVTHYYVGGIKIGVFAQCMPEFDDWAPTNDIVIAVTVGTDFVKISTLNEKTGTVTKYDLNWVRLKLAE